MSEWDGIHGYQAWSEKLAGLLDECETVAQQSELAPRLALSRRLTEFIVHSTPNTDEVMALDALAGETRKALMRQSIDERLTAITANSGELARLTKAVRASAEGHRQQAARLRLERGRELVDSLTGSVRAIGEFRTLLDSGSDAELVASLDRALAQLQRVRSAVERIG